MLKTLLFLLMAGGLLGFSAIAWVICIRPPLSWCRCRR